MSKWRFVTAALPAVFLLSAFSAWAEPDARDSNSPFGVLDFPHWDHDWNAHHYSGDKVERAARLMQEAGIGFIRMDFLWDDIEPEKGRFVFDKYDRIVDIFSRHQIKILAMLDYNTSWGGDNWNSAPDAELFANYARRVVDRYKDRIKYWEIWNEPDQAIYWVPQDDLKAYTELLKKIYPIIKSEDPTAVVVLGGLSGGCVLPLKRIYKNGGGPYFDVVNIHPFANPIKPTGFTEFRGAYRGSLKVMQAYGDGDKPIWFTEIGSPGMDAPLKAPNWWLGENPDEIQQAAWVEKIYTEALKWKGVKKIFWAFFRDTPDHFLSGTDFFGLVREDFSLKPSYKAYQKISGALRPAAAGNADQMQGSLAER